MHSGSEDENLSGPENIPFLEKKKKPRIIQTARAQRHVKRALSKIEAKYNRVDKSDVLDIVHMCLVEDRGTVASLPIDSFGRYFVDVGEGGVAVGKGEGGFDTCEGDSNEEMDSEEEAELAALEAEMLGEDEGDGWDIHENKDIPETPIDDMTYEQEEELAEEGLKEEGGDDFKEENDLVEVSNKEGYREHFEGGKYGGVQDEIPPCQGEGPCQRFFCFNCSYAALGRLKSQRYVTVPRRGELLPWEMEC
eukprot:comp22608_c0_seq1/m.34701 comp22608_c0_seq1/g.34701  ORF comp22608_c0_seq1/g.34701 comp22608_c0_seq1/m.34701 type:complete len:250 (-) comp22608_c0_seq1:59-808(-)